MMDGGEASSFRRCSVTLLSLVPGAYFCFHQRVARVAPNFSEKDLQQWKLIADFRACLVPLLGSAPLDSSWSDPRRRLECADYLCLFLFALVNPVVATLRGICAATQLQRVQEEVSSHYASLGSLSEAQHLLDPALLEPLIESLGAQIHGPLPADPRAAWQEWFARDSSLFAALPRMAWAHYGGGQARASGAPHRAVRLHVSFHLLDDKPARAHVTAGRVCERKSLRQQLERGATYVGDRYYGEDYKLFAELEKKGCSFVLRLRDEAVLQVEEELSLREEDGAAHVSRDAWVRLGRHERDRTARLRVITIQSATAGALRLVTNIPPEELSAAQVGAMYRRRWQIEGFFRWVKCVLGCRHFLAESERGVTLQLYLALIAGLMLHLLLGRRPNKRLMERLRFYLLGWASAGELAQATMQAL